MKYQFSLGTIKQEVCSVCDRYKTKKLEVLNIEKNGIASLTRKIEGSYSETIWDIKDNTK